MLAGVFSSCALVGESAVPGSSAAVGGSETLAGLTFGDRAITGAAVDVALGLRLRGSAGAIRGLWTLRFLFSLSCGEEDAMKDV